MTLPRMAFLDTLGRWLTGGTTTPAPAVPSASAGIASPWAGAELSRVVWNDILGTENRPATRAEAMGIPAIARGRHIIAATIAGAPLVTMRDALELEPAPWLYRTNTATSPQHRMAWTVDDLIFHGWSLWIVSRDPAGRILDAARCPREWWTFGPNGAVTVNGTTPDASAVVLIPGFHEGILQSAPRTIRAARTLETLWAARAANPTPVTELHQTTPDQLEDAEISALLAGWRTAIDATNGTVGYTPSSIELRTHGDAAADLLIQGRNAAAIDAGRCLGLPASMIDASNVNSTLTYETTQGRGSEFRDYTLPLYTLPIAARFSLDDVTPPGTRIAFDLSGVSATNPDPTGPATKD